MTSIAINRRFWLRIMAVVLSLGGMSEALQAQTATPVLPTNYQQLSQADFASLCETWIGITDPAVQADETTLAQYAWNNWLDDQTKAAALTADQFMTLTTLATTKLSNDDCQILSNVFLRRFPASTDVQALSLTSLDRLSGPVAVRLGFTGDQVGTWLGSWVDGHTQAGSVLSLPDAARAWDICQEHLAASAPALATLAGNMWNNYLKAPAGWTPVADTDVMGYYNRLRGFLAAPDNATLCKNVWQRLNADPAQIVQQMVMMDFRRLKGEIIPDANVPMQNLLPLLASFVNAKSGQCTLNDLSFAAFVASWFRQNAQLEGTATTIYQTVVTATVNQLSQNTPVTGFDDNYNSFSLGRAFESDADRQLLANQFTSPVLENRLAAAQILTWSYFYAGKISDWQTQLAAKASDPQADTDTKAFWLAVSGDADEAKYWNGRPHADPQAWRKHQWLDKAFATAQGEPMRILILEEYAGYFRTMARPGDGAKLLASVIGQFTPDSAKKIASLQQSLEGSQSYQDAMAMQAHLAGLKASEQLRLEYLETCLVRSQATNNQKAVARLQAAITDLQTQMKQATQ